MFNMDISYVKPKLILLMSVVQLKAHKTIGLFPMDVKVCVTFLLLTFHI